MSNIDNELAFGEYVSLPIRTENTAEQKWIELGKQLNQAYLNERGSKILAVMQNDTNQEAKSRYTMRGLLTAINIMDRLDGFDT